MSPPGCSYSLRTSSTTSTLGSVEFSHSTSFRVFETTSFGSALIRSAKPKSRGADEVAEVIRRVAAGGRYVDPEVAADALSDERSPLTDRELDVLRAGRRGETTGQIARTLSLAPGTVRNHVSAVLSKLAVSTRQQAVLIAEERGWI